MAQDRNSQVRERAHAIWLEEGMPEGQAEQHWNRAETEFDADEASATITPASVAEDAGADAAPSFDTPPEFENPEPAPAAPEVAAIPSATSKPDAKPAPAAAKKPARRKTKPVTPIR